MAQQYSTEGGGTYVCLSRKEYLKLCKHEDADAFRDAYSGISPSNNTIKLEVVPGKTAWMATLLIQAGIHVVSIRGEGSTAHANGLENWNPPLE